MRFFFDRCVPVAIARMVRGLEEGGPHKVIYLDERFTNTTPDEEWLAALKADGEPVWRVISADVTILRSKVQRHVLKGTGLVFFGLDGAGRRIRATSTPGNSSRFGRRSSTRHPIPTQNASGVYANRNLSVERA